MDLYELLEIDEEDFNMDLLKKQYHKMCFKHHPDKGGDSDHFKLIQEAYEVLSDDNTKEIYYVFKNVTKKVTCGYVLCDPGNGILDKTFYNYKDAVTYIVDDEKIAAKKKPKKTITIVEDNKETEDELLEKAKKIHPDDTFPALDELSNETSLFRNPDRKNANL